MVKQVVLYEIGKWAKDRIECIGCSNGKYSNTLVLNDDECKLCPIEKFNDDEGLSNELDCKICDNGKIGIIEGAKLFIRAFYVTGKYKKLKKCDTIIPMVGSQITRK